MKLRWNPSPGNVAAVETKSSGRRTRFDRTQRRTPWAVAMVTNRDNAVETEATASDMYVFWPQHQTWEPAAELVPACPGCLARPSSSGAWAPAWAGEGLECRWRLMKGNTLAGMGRRNKRIKGNERWVKWWWSCIEYNCHLFLVSWGTIALASKFL